MKNELREEVDVLSVQEKRLKILVDLDELSRKLQEDYDASPVEFKASLVNAAVSAMKLVLGELARAERADAGVVEALNARRVAELVRLVQETVDVSVGEVCERFGLDEDVLFEVFNRNLLRASGGFSDL